MIDPRALCAAEEAADSVTAGDIANYVTRRRLYNKLFLAGVAWARHAAGPPESPAPPASPPPEGGFPIRRFILELERIWTHPLAYEKREHPSDVEYLSLAEHFALLAEAKQQGRAEALDDVLAAAERIYQEEMESDPSDYFFTKQAVNECRPTPSKGEK